MRNDTPVELLLVESGTSVGGTERVVWELATRLSPDRFSVQVWLSPDRGVHELARALEARRIPVERMPEVDSRWDLSGMLSTWNKLRRTRPRLMHLHHVWPASDRYLPSLARAAGVPDLVVTEHIVGQSHSTGQRALKRDELQQAAAVTVVCAAVADSLVRDYGVDRKRLRVVPNGADLPDDDAEILAARRIRDELEVGDRALWVCAGRLEEQKGQRVLLDAAEKLAARGVDFVIALAGEGAERNQLEQRSQQLGLRSRVKFLGRLDVVGPLLRAADVCVLPSLWEGMPLSLLEAMVRGRPTIASAVGGVPEVMTDGVHGLLVPPGDVEALAAALEWMESKPEAAGGLGAHGAERVRSEFTWDHVVRSFEAVYDEVLGLASFAPEPAGAGRGGRQ